MTTFNNASSGTESSVPVAATNASDQNMAAAAAFRTMLSAMANFSQASAPPPQPALSRLLLCILDLSPFAPAPLGGWHALQSRSYRPLVAGLYVGITLNNALALGAVSGVSRSTMKSFKSQVLALASFNELLGYGMVAVLA
ncbi:hypothetical protein B0H13DRAFT_2344882 [Mycena leptocephala]|nr:hypothetical protein B0H13DRAFT_2344882 [Mycena leptocephala]